MKKMICRLCLQAVSNNNCQLIEESLLKSLKLNINICKENVMCIDCANCLHVFSNFTPSSVCTGGVTLLLSNLNNGVKLESEAIETKTNLKSIMETEIRCSFCTQTYGREALISMKESNENKHLVNALERYNWETNLKDTEELLTCETCLKALQGGLSVILKCLEVEEKISKYVELEGADDKGQVELEDVQKFMFGPIIKSEIESISVDKLTNRCDQVEEEYTGMAEAKIKYDEIAVSDTELIIKMEEDDIKSKQNHCDIADIKSEQSDSDGIQEHINKNESHKDPPCISVVLSETKKFKDGMKQHLLTHKYPSEIKKFKCGLCAYETKYKGNLRQHLVIHKNPSKINMFKCDSCSYQARRKSNLECHVLTHKHPSDIKMFKCEFCSYEAKRKGQLKTHLLTHKNSFEIKMFKCKLCSYEAKLKGNLKKHLLTHETPSEIKMFRCALCSYEVKHKHNLKTHLLVHKSSSEVKMFKCELCPFETKYNNAYKLHLLVHKSPSDVKMFKCDSCPYEAKRKCHLKTHLLTHKRPSEAKMFKCELCPYETNYKVSHRRHLLIHTKPPKKKILKCDLCLYETKYSNAYKLHFMTHKSPLEITLFKCDLCSYEAKQKCHLKTHLLTHKSPSEVEMFKCELCSHETKYNNAFKRHLLTHKSPMERYNDEMINVKYTDMSHI